VGDGVLPDVMVQLGRDHIPEDRYDSSNRRFHGAPWLRFSTGASGPRGRRFGAAFAE